MKHIDYANEDEIASVRAEVDAGARAESRKPTPLPLGPPSREPRPYPVAALGSVLSGATESIAQKCQCPSRLRRRSPSARSRRNASPTCACPTGKRGR